LKHYPIFLDLKDRPVVVVGAEPVRVSPWWLPNGNRNSKPFPCAWCRAASEPRTSHPVARDPWLVADDGAPLPR